MGYVFGLQCYGDQQDAIDAYYSSIARHAQASGSNTVETYYQSCVSCGYTSNWRRIVETFDSSGVQLSAVATEALVPTFPACDPAQNFLDGMTVGWGIGSAMLLVAAVMFMKRAAR